MRSRTEESSMKRTWRVVVIVGPLAFAACASQAPATSTGGGASQQPSPTAAARSKAPSGYYRKVVDGQEVFCRNDVDLGSHVQRSEKCLTQEQLEEQQRNSHNVMQDIQRSGVR
jgi:hypothetical protein